MTCENADIRGSDEELVRLALRELARDAGEQGASATVAARLAGEVRELGRVRRRRRRFTCFAAAASTAIVVLVWQGVATRPETAPRASPVAATIEVPDFLPLPYAFVPAGGAQVVRIAIPRAALTAFGFGPGAPGGSDVVILDVLVGDDGLARGVHLVGTIGQEHKR